VLPKFSPEEGAIVKVAVSSSFTPGLTYKLFQMWTRLRWEAFPAVSWAVEGSSWPCTRNISAIGLHAREIDDYQKCERCGPRNIDHFKVFPFSDQNYSIACLWPRGILRQKTREKFTVVTHRDCIAAWTLWKFALLSVGDTYRVPAGHPVNGEVSAFFCNWHARYSGESACICTTKLARHATRPVRRVEYGPIGASPVEGVISHPPTVALHAYIL
jgi:hypothetical protein